MMKTTNHGLTLIELVVALVVSILIAAALYFTLQSSLESWDVTQEQLVLQHVLAQTAQELIDGWDNFGIRDGLEIKAADATSVSLIMPWSDDSYQVLAGVNTYELIKKIKPGTGIPIAEALLPGKESYEVIPIKLLDPGRQGGLPQVYLSIKLPVGTLLRFTYHPDSAQDPQVMTTFRFDAEAGVLLREDEGGVVNISKNPFGVKVKGVRFRYFDNLNREIDASGDISARQVNLISGIEINISVISKYANIRESMTFVALRNAPTRTGNILLKEGDRFPIPNSENIRALTINNFFGVDNDSQLVLKATPSSGKEWQLKIKFAKTSSLSPALIDSYSIEYPEGNVVYSEQPRVSAEQGINLLSLGTNGRFDYDDDGLEDQVFLEGDVELSVEKMELTGASLFVKP